MKRLCSITIFLTSTALLLTAPQPVAAEDQVPKPKIIPAKTITSSLPMTIKGITKGYDDFEKKTPGTVQIPESLGCVCCLTGLTPENVDDYKKTIKENGLKNITILNVNNSKLKKYRDAGLFENVRALAMSEYDKVQHQFPSSYKNSEPSSQNPKDFLTDLSPLSGLKNLTSLDLVQCEHVTDLSPLSTSKNLVFLALGNCNDQTNFAPLGNIDGLRQLFLANSEKLTNLSTLANLKQLKQLHVANCYSIKDISPLSNLRNLDTLTLNTSEKIDVSPLSKLTNLTFLFLNGNEFTGLSTLTSLKKLKSFDLSCRNQFTDLTPLSKLTNLTELSIDSLKLKNLSGMASLKNLKSFSLCCNNPTSLSGLSDCKSLESLSLMCSRADDYSPVGKLENLKSLDCFGCSNLTDVSVFAGLKKLKRLYISACGEDKPKGIKELQKQLPNCKIEIN